jgi:hypothetical protein
MYAPSGSKYWIDHNSCFRSTKSDHFTTWASGWGKNLMFERVSAAALLSV